MMIWVRAMGPSARPVGYKATYGLARKCVAMTAATHRRIVPGVSIVSLLDHLPETIAHRPGRVWNVFARSLGEQGADGRTALAWRWALTGTCTSPVSLGASLGRPPDRGELLAEANATAELGATGDDPGGQIMHARLVLRWLVGDLDAVPLWNVGQLSQVTDGAASPRSRADIEEAYRWALLACSRYPWPGDNGRDATWMAFGRACAARQFLGWALGEETVGPLAGLRTSGRPSLYEMSLDVRRAMTALVHARNDDQPTLIGRIEATMATFLWLVGWDAQLIIDRQGHIALASHA